MQIQTTMRYHFPPVRLATVQKARDNYCWWECGEKGMLVHCWWECKLVQPLWKTVWRFFKKLKIELPNDSVIQFLGICPKEMKSGYQRGICCSIIHNSQGMETI